MPTLRSHANSDVGQHGRQRSTRRGRTTPTSRALAAALSSRSTTGRKCCAVLSGGRATRRCGASIEVFGFGRRILFAVLAAYCAGMVESARRSPGPSRCSPLTPSARRIGQKAKSPPWETLRDRAAQSGYVRGRVPRGALLLMIGIDCQGDRVEWQLVGFGEHYKRFVIDYGIVDRHISDADCQRNLDLVLERRWTNWVGREIGVDFAAVDGNAWTEDVWSFARRHSHRRLIMVRGRGDDAAPRLALVKRERHEKTGELLAYSSRFYNLGASVLKMSLYRDLLKTDQQAPGYVSFPRGLDAEYFQELTAERRTPVRRHGFTVYRWTKDDRQDNEALDTMIIATGAAIRCGAYGLSDRGWEKIRLERETPPAIKPPLQPGERRGVIASRLAR